MKKQAMNENIKNEIDKGGIIAVLEIENEKNAVPLAKALLDGGITIIELALRTPAAIPSISLIAKEVPQMFLGVGTIIEAEQVSMLRNGSNQNDVRFGVSPGINPEIVKKAIEADLPFAPGIATPSELELAISLGCTTVKFFPAEGLGGLNYLKSINAPYNHLGIKYIPLGGVSVDNLASYAKFNSVLAIGGSWIATKELINTQNWAEITKRAKDALDIWKTNR
ncbi:MAG: bifunctional 4-hydroxy-2-oxoglutarate aldolase/2-dehydro-3-deoxy-phosphogluconate aldolase [Treponema sp.]|nr:bifunctional 4-hydroxy-2-oxoglutarate aldolase/2-dehydro-3-deoxy-phosphogluconate aldolase [Treponema sp.]MCL2251576.1 bifunctional 4-hydroxy-2-oxoglutarate aldolase/2-dehydro-3-deoxy-phosphogluconate aldolase [Treponema sp.]